LFDVSHQITKRQPYYIMCHGCLSKREERFFKKKEKEKGKTILAFAKLL
jgi:hypothetical protein